MIRSTAARVAALVTAGVVTAACSSVPTGVGLPSVAVGVAPVQALSGPGGSWATVVMGHLHDPLNAFGELVYRPACAGSCTPGAWALATPPGVASNGGLFAALGPGGTLTVGFGVSLDLTFSPLAATADAGATWSTGILPAALLPVTDSLATRGPAGLALVTTGGGEVLASPGALSSWTVLTRGSAVAGATSRSGCTGARLSAVSFDGAGALVGVDCSSGDRVGVFRVGAGAVSPVGPVMPVASGGGFRVERLVETGAGLEALVTSGNGSATRVWLATSVDDAATWTVSAPLAVGGPVTSTSVDASGAVVVVASTRAVAAAPGVPWAALGVLPAGTTVVAIGPVGTYSALVPSGSVLTVFVRSAGSWVRHQVLAVPIQYGSTAAGGTATG